MNLLLGDCAAVLRTLPAESVDAVVTDPPYELTSARPGGRGPATEGAVMKGFMGMAWDGSGIAYSVPMWREVLRVLKPGGHLLSFGGTRTYHRMACAIEDAGFEIRDQMQWIYGSGFPKSRNLHGEWEGWGTALKPANEPICVGRKPLGERTVDLNVKRWGPGALNIDGCRVPMVGVKGYWPGEAHGSHPGISTTFSRGKGGEKDGGRWPANIIMDEEAGAILDAQAPEAGAATKACGPARTGANDLVARGMFAGSDGLAPFYADKGGASRFFYCAKASRSEREAGLAHLQERVRAQSSGAQGAEKRGEEDYQGEGGIGLNRITKVRNHHPTVKPVALMRYLCRLITPRGGVVLDPFTGSGTTGVAASLEGFDFIGVEREVDYIEIARGRIHHAILGDLL